MVEIGPRQLSALIEAGIALASELQLDALLQRIADLSREVIGARYGAVGVVDLEGRLTEFVHSGVDDATVDRIGHLPEGKGLLGVIITEGRPLRLKEISDHPQSAGFPEGHPEMRTFLGVPISGRGRVLGRLYLSEKEDGAEFTKDDERMAMMFAAQAGVAIENASLYDEVSRRGAELARRVEELSSVEQVGYLIISESDIDEPLNALVDEARALTRGSCGLLLLLQDDGYLRLRASSVDSGSSDLDDILLPPGTSKAHAVIERRRPEIVADLARDREVHSDTLVRLGYPRSGAFVPLVVHGRGIGALAIYDHDAARSFSFDDLTVLQLLANQAAIAVENERLTEALRDLAVLEERERISKELHDGVIQSIYSVGLSLQGSLALMRRDADGAAARIDQAIAELDNVVRDVRSYIFELVPKHVTEHGLTETVRQLARDIEVNALVDAHIDFSDPACEALDQAAQNDVVQIVREVLSNIARHAQASQVWITCAPSTGQVVMTVEDDGVGFDPHAVVRGHGLNNIERRAEKVGGTLEILPREPKGTVHRIRIPANREEG
jgi:signal transduction histidine kinase